ncbi:MAG TPA: TlpA disulfide reductase family protein [Candidatus Acidoferrales bacterium]|jgi:peroxiredoxin|nr:TlpA disulfide reductase family protein [Candidatus Acidoferrales bacterium]
MNLILLYSRLRIAVTAVLAAGIYLSAATLLVWRPAPLHAQEQRIVWSDREKPIADQIGGLRALPDDVRAHTTKNLALDIRQLPATPNKLRLANSLAMLSTEGDLGHEMLQEVATTLAAALREQPQPTAKMGQPPRAYVELAELVRYEHVQATLDDPQFTAATSKIETDNERREQADFTLADLGGKNWTLKELRGKVVLLNFWATWCPPCRKEMPDLETLYNQWKDQGLVILAISDEDAGKVRPFIGQQKVSYPILLDPGRKVNELFQIQGIPKTFVYDRTGKLAAQSIDMRTRRQFLEMLADAGLK